MFFTPLKYINIINRLAHAWPRQLLRTEEEAAVKDALWYEANKEFLDKQAEREAQLEEDRRLGRVRPASKVAHPDTPNMHAFTAVAAAAEAAGRGGGGAGCHGGRGHPANADAEARVQEAQQEAQLRRAAGPGTARRTRPGTSTSTSTSTGTSTGA